MTTIIYVRESEFDFKLGDASKEQYSTYYDRKLKQLWYVRTQYKPEF